MMRSYGINVFQWSKVYAWMNIDPGCLSTFKPVFMILYTSGPDAISDLHQRGFTNDFQLFGNDLLWIQEGFFIRAGEFAILEYHRVNSTDDNGKNELNVFGIFLPYHDIKGILLNDA